MVKHAQTILSQQPANYFRVFDHFVGLPCKGLWMNFQALLNSEKHLNEGETWHEIGEVTATSLPVKT